MPNTLRLHHSTIQVHTLHILHILIYILDYAEYCFRHDKLKKIKMFLIMINLTL